MHQPWAALASALNLMMEVHQGSPIPPPSPAFPYAPPLPPPSPPHPAASPLAFPPFSFLFLLHLHLIHPLHLLLLLLQLQQLQLLAKCQNASLLASIKLFDVLYHFWASFGNF